LLIVGAGVETEGGDGADHPGGAADGVGGVAVVVETGEESSAVISPHCGTGEGLRVTCRGALVP
jgi:hypothetical protein